MHQLALVATETAFLENQSRDALEGSRGYEIFEPWREAFWKLNGTEESTAYYVYPNGVQQYRWIEKETYNKSHTRDAEALLCKRAAARLAWKYPGTDWSNDIRIWTATGIPFDCQNMKESDFESRFVDRTLSTEELEEQWGLGDDQALAWRKERLQEKYALDRAAGGSKERWNMEAELYHRTGRDLEAERQAVLDEIEAKQWAEGKPPAWPPPETVLEHVTAVFKGIGRVR